MYPLFPFDNDHEHTPGRSPVCRGRPTTLYRFTRPDSSHVPRTIADPLMGEALFGDRELHTPAPAPNLPRAITNPRMGEALTGRQDLHAHGLLALSRERSRTLAWAKPCLAGRPTMLVRTQLPETNTSRSRPSGMELPDYPVVVLTPSCRTRMGPHLRFPPGLFPDS
jgi:hypothetical protein